MSLWRYEGRDLADTLGFVGRDLEEPRMVESKNAEKRGRKQTRAPQVMQRPASMVDQMATSALA